MKFCNIGKYILGAFIIGIGTGIIASDVFGAGYICAFVCIGIGIWRTL